MQRAALPFSDSRPTPRPTPSPHRIEAGLPLRLSPYPAWEEESERRQQEEKRSIITLFKQRHLQDDPSDVAVPDYDLPSFRSIPYNRTVQANPPRVVTTITSLTHLPGPASSSPPPHPGGNGEYSIGIPNSFKIYIRAFHRHPRAYLAHRKQEPLFALTYTLRDVTLHGGAQKASHAVATYVHHNLWNPKKRSAQVRLSTTGSGAGAELEVAARGSSALLPPYQKVIIKNSSLLTASFTVDVPSPAGGFRPETFQWRRSRGPAIAAAAAMGTSGSGSSSDTPLLTNRIHHGGMKLVRLATDARHGGGEVATGGGEVVAVLYIGSKLTTRGYFMFQGTGAQGILGDRFRIIAVMTAVGMWDRKRRRNGA